MLGLELSDGRHPHVRVLGSTADEDGRRLGVQAYKVVGGEVRRRSLTCQVARAPQVVNTWHNWLEGRLDDFSSYEWLPSQAPIMGPGSQGPRDPGSASLEAGPLALDRIGATARKPAPSLKKKPPNPQDDEISTNADDDLDVPTSRISDTIKREPARLPRGIQAMKQEEAGVPVRHTAPSLPQVSHGVTATYARSK